jgi:hypothetical protein
MRATVNRQMFTTRLFDSGSLGVLGTVIHQFAEAGRHEVVIRRGDVVAGTFAFTVDESSPNLQLDIDLATVGRAATAATAGHGDCACQDTPHAAASGALPAVSPKGYVLFYVSQGDGGFSVVVGRDGSERAVFDSTALGAGDLFAIALLAPTEFVMRNTSGQATGRITVSAAGLSGARLAAMDAVYVETSRYAFAPDRLEVSSGQGVVFRVTDAARIVIEQTGDPGGPEPARRHRVVARPKVAPRGPRGPVR